MVRVAVDVMGGDNAPGEIIKGCLKALRESAEIQLFLVGREEAIRRELEGESYDAVRLHIVNATEVIETGEAPVLSIRKKKDSSIVRGMRLVREQEADAFVSAGSSGAILVGGQLIVGRIPGVERAPFAPLVPTDRGGVTLLLDAGANVDARPKQLLQFAKMGSIYMEHVMGIPAPRVAILNIDVYKRQGLACAAFEFITGMVIIPGMAPIMEGMEIVSGIGIVLLGTFPVLTILTKVLDKPLNAIGQKLGMDATSAAGLVFTLANSVPVYTMMKDMKKRGIIINTAWLVPATAALGDHLGFTAGVQPGMITPVVAGKLSAGVAAIALGFIMTKNMKEA